MLLLCDPTGATARAGAVVTIERRRIAPVQPAVMRRRTTLPRSTAARLLLEADLQANQDAVVGVGVERQVGRDDVALQLHQDRDVVADLEALRQAEPRAAVE